MKSLTDMTLAELTAAYNEMVSEDKRIKKFRTKPDGIRRLTELGYGAPKKAQYVETAKPVAAPKRFSPIVVTLTKEKRVLPDDARAAFEVNEVLPDDAKVDPPTSGVLVAKDDRGTLVLILNENVDPEMQDAWLGQPIVRAHRRRMQKALEVTYGEQFTC